MQSATSNSHQRHQADDYNDGNSEKQPQYWYFLHPTTTAFLYVIIPGVGHSAYANHGHNDTCSTHSSIVARPLFALESLWKLLEAMLLHEGFGFLGFGSGAGKSGKATRCKMRLTCVLSQVGSSPSLRSKLRTSKRHEDSLA